MTVLQPIRPILYIGLGGTGKEVLLRLRRRVFDAFGIPTLPWTRFLYVDSDMCPVDNTFREVDLGPAERVPLFDGGTVATIEGILGKPEAFSFIHEWLDERILADWFHQSLVSRVDVQHSISHGAMGVRAIGRLMLFLKFAEIESAVKNALALLCQAETTVQTQYFCREHHFGDRYIAPPEPPMVQMVSSAVGGIGAGTLIDFAFFLRHLEATVCRLAGITSYVFLPNVYDSDPKGGPRAARGYANAYATLKELNHFCFRYFGDGVAGPTADFEVSWQERKPLKVMGPPVNVTHLFEMRNSSGVSLPPESRQELFSVLAEYLFLDATSDSFSSAVRSGASAVAPALAGMSFIDGNSGFHQAFSRRFAAFGLSKLEVPANTIRAACTAQLGADIAEYLLKEPQAGAFNYDALDALTGAQLNVDGIVSSFESEWRDIAARAIDTFFEKQAEGSFHDPGRLASALDELRGRLFSFDMSKRDKMGEVALFLRAGFDAVLTGGLQRADDLLKNSCLGPTNPGLTATLRPGGYLDTCVQQLTTFLKVDIEQRCDDNRRRAQAYREWQYSVYADLAAAKLGGTVRLLGAVEWTRGVLLERLRDATTELFHCEAHFLLYRFAREIISRVRTHLDCNRRNNLHRLLDFARLYAVDCERRAAEFQEAAAFKGVFFCRLFDKQLDWKRFYNLGGKENDGANGGIDAAAESELMTAGLGLGGGLIEVSEYLESQGFENLSSKITRHCDSRFKSDFESYGRSVDVLDHRLLKLDREAYVRRLVYAALPLVWRQDGQLGAVLPQTECFAYLGVANPLDPKYIQLGNEVAQQLRAQGGARYRVELYATGSPAEVCLYLSEFAFSLPSVQIVSHDGYRAYCDFYEEADHTANAQQLMIPLHLSKRWEGDFEELVEYSAEQFNTLREIISILLLGHISRVLVLKEVRGLHVYHYMLGRPFCRLEFMGPRRQVVASLLKDSRLRKALGDAIKQRENSLTPAQLLSYFLAVAAASKSPGLMRTTVDDLILNQQMKDLCARGGAALDAAFERIKGIDEPLRFEYLRKLENSGVEWVLDSYPTVQSLPIWELPIELQEQTGVRGGVASAERS